MSNIQTGRYEQFTRRLLRLVGGGIMPRIQNDISPVLNMEDPADDALLFWKGHRLANGFCTGTGAVAERGSCSIFNPLGSGVIIWVRQIGMGGAGAQVARSSFTQTRTGTVQTGLFFSDGRASLTSVPRAELGFDSLAVTPSPQGFLVAGGAQTAGQNWTPRFVLPPGVGLQITDINTNELLDVSFEWIERDAEISEFV